jgi:hypothetical protein
VTGVWLVVRFEHRLGTERPCTYDCYEVLRHDFPARYLPQVTINIETDP